jgi:hypothetical protein
MERSDCGLILRYYPSICLKGLRKIRKNSAMIYVLRKIRTKHLSAADIYWVGIRPVLTQGSGEMA